ncbi:MAG: hypothetical protein KBT39_13455 [Bacteroidales bacterium]|nr:hypothetical protein [Bacteroidales bacterium]
MNKLKSILTICLLCLAAQMQAVNQADVEINVGGQKRSLICYTPSAMTRNMPLFIVTHGMNQDPIYQRDGDRLWEMADTAKFVVCYLKSDGNTWDIGGSKDLNFVKQTITEMNRVYGIDKKRVYWSGFSMGSMLIYHGIENGMADYIAAFAPCSGVKFSEPWKNAKKPINLIHCHSKHDDVFPIDQYKPRDYAANFKDVNKCTEYQKWENYSLQGSGNRGDKERWWNGTNGSEVEVFMSNDGGHFPTQNYRYEIWNFCKRFSLDSNVNAYKKVLENAVLMAEEWSGEASSLYSLTTTYNTFIKTVDKYRDIDPTSMTADELKAANKALANATKTFTTAVANKNKTSKTVTLTDFDPNFHIYLCFGQSNMEGNAIPRLQDYAGSSKRFLMMAPVNMTSYSRYKGKWYVARPPLCRDNTGLTPADYFGRTLVKNLPDSIKVGVINVALGGCAIEMFNEDGIAEYLKKQVDWLQSYAKNYSNNPFRYLVDRAKEAQKKGVIKGILLHQGCSNNTQPDWPDKVNVIYQRLLDELGLSSEECPLLVGELMQQDQGGVCWGHNSVIAKVPSVIPNSYVISSKGCTGTFDGLHFTAEGYQKLGENYANTMLQLLARYSNNNEFSIKQLKAKSTSIGLTPNSSKSVFIMLTDAEDKEHDVTGACHYESSNPAVAHMNGVAVVAGSEEGDATITATFVNNNGEEAKVEFNVSVRMFSLDEGAFNPSLINTGTMTIRTNGVGDFKSSKGGMGGWNYSNGIDLSAYDSLVIDLSMASLAKPELRIFDTNTLKSTSYFATLIGNHVAVDLHHMTDAEGRTIDPSHIYYVGIAPTSTGSSSSIIKISNIYLVKGTTAIKPTWLEQPSHSSWYDLTGRKVSMPTHGIYIKDGKKVIKR